MGVSEKRSLRVLEYIDEYYLWRFSAPRGGAKKT